MADTLSQFNRTLPYQTYMSVDKKGLSTLPFGTKRNRELFRLRASRFVDIFPDELIIQEKTISIIRNQFLVSFMETLPLKDVGRVVYAKTPIFGGLRIIGKNTQHELRINGINKKQAIKAKEIIEGLLLEDAGAIEVPHWIETDHRRDILAISGRDSKNNPPS